MPATGQVLPGAALSSMLVSPGTFVQGPEVDFYPSSPYVGHGQTVTLPAGSGRVVMSVLPSSGQTWPLPWPVVLRPNAGGGVVTTTWPGVSRPHALTLPKSGQLWPLR